MFSQLAFPMLWAQAAAAPAAAPAMSQKMINTILWFIAFGEPMQTLPERFGILGTLLTYCKIVGLFSLVGWAGSWVLAANKDRRAPRAKWLDIAALVSLLGALSTVAIGVLEEAKRIHINVPESWGVSASTLIALPFLVVLFVWVERALWMTIARLGKASDLIVLGAVHMALVLGFVISYFAHTAFTSQKFAAADVIVAGLRLGATYMGLVVLLRVLAIVTGELISLRPRRLYAIAKLSVVEATRRMWAPWVVLVVFLVILAFSHWFLQAPDQRPAEIGRLYINTLMMVCSLLITVMVAVLSPISLPQDIQNQTIYTVVSKPVRRLEVVWGRMLGFMALVTFLMVIFGGACLAYLWRNVNGTIQDTVAQADALADKDPLRSKQLLDQAEQLRTKMSARVPVRGSLSFLDSKGNPQIRGVDVGQELEFRSHIEGATPATAIWAFGSTIKDPFDPRKTINRRIPVEQFLKAGTIEDLENRALLAEYGVDAINRGQGPAGASDSEKARMATTASADVQRLRTESQKLQQQAADLEAKADAADKAGDKPKAEGLRDEAALLHSPPLMLEMTFTIYRTTKGRVGEPVYAEIEVANGNKRVSQTPFRNIFPIREYYTNKQMIPASYLVGSNGELLINIRCVSATQYLGMAESDMHILLDQGNFALNFCLGLAGIWLQAMVLTAIGVFAGTFLSWPMALLTTIAFFVAGQVAFQLFQEIQMQSLVGGGPFESLIRLLTHDNQMSELTPTLAVIVAKTCDALTMPVLTRLAYIVPNFQILDVTNRVAEGFAVPWVVMLNNGLLALGYALPFTIGGYFILKNREVAA